MAFAPNDTSATAFMRSVAASLACPANPNFKAQGAPLFPALFAAPNPQASLILWMCQFKTHFIMHRPESQAEIGLWL